MQTDGMKHILVAEDEPHTRLSLGILLKRAGYRVTCVPDGYRAFESLKGTPKDSEGSFSLLMADVNMPEMGGVELLKSMKLAGISVPTLVFTGFGDKGTVVELLREGCEEYIDKPFSEADLLERIRRILERAEARERDREETEQHVRDVERKMDGYRSAFLRTCSSLETAVETYKRLVAMPVTSSKVKVALKRRSKDRLGGDYCAIHDSLKGCDILVADVAGHDMGASYHTVLLKSFFDVNCSLGAPGDEFFHILNRELLKEEGAGRMATAIFLRLDLESLCSEMVSAAHPFLLRFSREDAANILRPIPSHSGFPLGMNSSPVFESRRLKLSAGDRIFIYTDGLPNARSFEPGTGRRERFGDIRIREALQRHESKTLDEMLSRAWDEIMEYCKGKPGDDMLLLGLEMPMEQTCHSKGGDDVQD